MTRIRRPAAFVAVAAASLALVAAPLAPASAATKEGWIRLAHMSPDTAAVDVTLSSLSGDVVLFKLTNVGYGAVSKYMRLPEGTYALAMRPAGSAKSATPVVSGSVDVDGGGAETVAAIGLNKDLQTKAFSDDLAMAGGDQAKVRIVQASVKHKSVDVKAGSTSLASGATFGTVGDYKEVPAGSTTLALSSGGSAVKVTEDLSKGSAHTLFVIDDKQGDLTVSPAVDSSSATVMPVGSIAAGGGGLAAPTAGVAGLLAAVTAAAGVVAAAAMLRRRRGIRI